MTLKIGIVGIGYGQQVLLPVFQEDERVTVAGLCASTEERARAVADQHGVPGAYGDPAALIADVDAVVIAVPPQHQPEIALAALAAGKPIFLEKPLATSVEDAQRIADAAQRANLPNVIDFEFPEIPAWGVARDRVAQMGPLRHVEVVWNIENYSNRARLENWKTGREGGGALYNFMSHVFYYLPWFVGQPITSVSATLTKAPTDPRAGDTLDAITVTFADDLAGVISVSTHAFSGSGHRITFYGDDATLVLENTTKDYMHGFTVRYAERDADDTPREIPVPAGDPNVDGRRLPAGRLARRWVSWMLDGTPTGPTAADGLAVQRLIAAAQQSNDTGTRVML
jgi:predicted dehydrogenase